MSTLKRIYHSRIFRAILEVALSFALAFALLMFLRTALGVENCIFVVSSGSMSPTINVGDLIIVQAVKPAQVSIGDIVVFRDPYARLEAPIVHRVVDIIVDRRGNYRFATSGDAIGTGWDQFSPWDASLLIGRVILRIPYLGNLYLPLLSKNRALVIVLVAITLLITLLLLSGGEDKKDSRTSRKNIYWSGKYIAYILAINLLLIFLLLFSLWGQGVNFLGMYEEYRLNVNKYGDENVFLMINFMTYRIDCLVHGSIRRGVLTFSWAQFILLILLIFDVVKVLIPIVRLHLLKNE